MTDAAPPSISPQRINPQWIADRQALHEAFDRRCEPPDASWLSFLGRPDRAFTTQEVAALWAQAPRDPGARPSVNHVYLHVPFCKSICSFCNYERLKPHHPDLLLAYERRLLEALDALAPSLQGIAWSTLYLGGGTPSVLPADALRRIVRAIDARLQFVPNSTRYFELDPAVMSTARLDALVELGFHHFSFGVQTLDAAVNQAHNRGAQGPDLVSQRFAELRARGIHDVSCDFLLGLKGTRLDQILAEIRQVIDRHRPTWIDAYMVTPTPEYLKSHFGGSREAFDAHLQPFLEGGSAGLRAIAEEKGYVFVRGEGHAIGMYDHRVPELLPDGSQPNLFGEYIAYSQLSSQQDAPLHLLGLGTSARSRIFGGAFFEYRDPDDDIGAPGPAGWQGYPVDLRDEGLTWLVHDLRDTDALDRGVFAEVFGVDVVDLFPEAVGAWRALGLLKELSPERLVLQPASRAERLRTLLWLVPEERLDWELARRLGVDLRPEALAARLAPIAVGTTFGSWRVAAFEPARIRLRHREGEVALRLRPDPQGGEVPELQLEGTAPAGGLDELRSVVRILRRGLRSTTRARLESR